VAFAAAASAVVAAIAIVPPVAHAQNYHINNVDGAARIHMRQLPSNRSKVVAYITPDGRLEGTGKCDSKWCEVRFNGVRGWVFRKYLVAGPKTVAAKPSDDGEEKTVAALHPRRSDASKDIPPDLQDTMLRLVFTAGRPIPVYTFPSDRLPAAGRIDPGTEEVEDLGTCTRKFCYVRHGSLVGWIPDEAIVKEDTAPHPPQAFDNTVPTATQAAGPVAAAIIDALGSGTEVKSYTLAGLSGDASLPLRDGPEDSARITGWIPGDAKGVEGLRKCVNKYCMVRYESQTGWVARRHLADEGSSQRYQVSGVALWGALDVVDYPSDQAAVIGHIPAYATGIVPIGGCDSTWCHVRYLGIAGWISAKFIAPQQR